jgi:hypothetical protein
VATEPVINRQGERLRRVRALRGGALQRLVIHVAPYLTPHCVKSGFAVRTNPVYHSADPFSLGGLPMTSPSLDQPIRVEVIAYVPTRFNH